MKKTVVIALLIIFLMTTGIFADASSFKTGINLTHKTISKTSDINGGSYLGLDYILSFSENFSLKLNYSTDIAPNRFSDHLLAIGSQFNFTYSSSDPTVQMYVAPYYMMDMDDKENKYYGIKVCPLNMGRTNQNNTLVDIIPIGYFYSPSSEEHLFTFEFVSMGGLF